MFRLRHLRTRLPRRKASHSNHPNFAQLSRPKPYSFCSLRDAGIFFEGPQSTRQRMFLLKKRAGLARYTLSSWFVRLPPETEALKESPRSVYKLGILSP